MTPLPLDAKKYDNIHAGKPGFVLGSGPSVRAYSPELISDLSKEIVIGVNHAYALFTPTYLLFSDCYFWNNYKEEIKNLDSIVLCPDDVSNSVGMEGKHFYFLKRDSGKNGGINAKPSSFKHMISFWNNSGVTALRVAYILGCNPIYLVGIDLKRRDSEGNTHHHNKYPKKRSASIGDNKYKLFKTAFNMALKSIKNYGVKVYSCSPVSTLNETLEFKNLEDVLKKEQV